MTFNQLFIVVCGADRLSLCRSLRWNASEEPFPPSTLQVFHYYMQGGFPWGKDLGERRKPANRNEPAELRRYSSETKRRPVQSDRERQRDSDDAPVGSGSKDRC